MQQATTERRIVPFLGGVLLVGLLVPIGCTVEPELKPQARPHVSDVPVPNGFDRVEKRSRSYQNQTGLRWVDYLYEGRKETFDVVQFYEKHMLTYHWEPQTTQTAQGQTTLDFTKDHEQCRITVSGGGAFTDTFIHLSITPGNHVGPPTKAKK